MFSNFRHDQRLVFEVGSLQRALCSLLFLRLHIALEKMGWVEPGLADGADLKCTSAMPSSAPPQSSDVHKQLIECLQHICLVTMTEPYSEHQRTQNQSNGFRVGFDIRIWRSHWDDTFGLEAPSWLRSAVLYTVAETHLCQQQAQADEEHNESMRRRRSNSSIGESSSSSVGVEEEENQSIGGIQNGRTRRRRRRLRSPSDPLPQSTHAMGIQPVATSMVSEDSSSNNDDDDDDNNAMFFDADLDLERELLQSMQDPPEEDLSD